MYKESIGFKTIVQKIIEIENKFNLHNFEIQGIYVWQAARVKIYLKITSQLIDNNQVTANDSIKKIFFKLLRRIFVNSFIFNPYISFKKSDILIFESGRKYYDNNKYVDIYTIDLYNEFINKNISCSLYETNFQSDTKSRNFKTKHLDFIYLFSKLYKLFIRPNLTLANINTISEIENEISQYFGINISLSDIFIEEIKIFKSQYPFYKKLFELKNPREIYITNSSDKPSLIRAAKDLNIVVNELQHGLITKEDLIGHFPNVENDTLAYFPDKFLIWKDLEMCTSKLPISETNIRYINCSYLQRWKDQTRNIAKEEKTILVISQPFSSTQIQSFIEKNIESMSDYVFLYKIHPSEDKKLIAMYIERLSTRYQNIHFYSNEQSIYIMMQKANYVIGIFSSALFEAPHFGCELLLLDLPGVEMASSLISKGKAKLVNTHKSLAQQINLLSSVDNKL